MINPDNVPIVPFEQRDTVRLISTAYIDEPALTPLADDEDELEFLASIEELTCSRQNTGMPLPSGVYAQELLNEHDGNGWTYVNAAFCYIRSTGNRFNGPDRGAWYACWENEAVETAHAEVSWHLTRELEATGVYENITNYRELIAGFIIDMHDLREFVDDGIFALDPDQAYPKGQALAASLRQSGSQGIIYPSVRRAGGFCLAAFRPRAVQNVRQGDTWMFEWSGDPTPTIMKE